MIQMLRAMDTLIENLGSVLSTQLGLKTIVNSSSTESDALFQPSFILHQILEFYVSPECN